MSDQCRVTVYDAGPTLIIHLFDISCFGRLVASSHRFLHASPGMFALPAVAWAPEISARPCRLLANSQPIRSPAYTTRSNNDVLMLDQRRRRWSNNKILLFQPVVLAESVLPWPTPLKSFNFTALSLCLHSPSGAQRGDGISSSLSTNSIKSFLFPCPVSSQKAVTALPKSKQLLAFSFAQQHSIKSFPFLV